MLPTKQPRTPKPLVPQIPQQYLTFATGSYKYPPIILKRHYMCIIFPPCKKKSGTAARKPHDCSLVSCINFSLDPQHHVYSNQTVANTGWQKCINFQYDNTKARGQDFQSVMYISVPKNNMVTAWIIWLTLTLPK